MSASAPVSTHYNQAPPLEGAAKPNGVPISAASAALVVRAITLESLRLSKTNPRKTQNEKADQELIASIKQHGVLQPVLVRPLGDGGLYELVAGSRRFAAAKAAGLAAVPASIRSMTDEQALEIQIIENLQRVDVRPIEEGRGYRALLEMRIGKGGMKAGARQAAIERIAGDVGKSVRYVYARMKLVELLPALQEALEKEKISPSHADLLVMLEPAQQQKAAKELLGGRFYRDEQVMSVRELKQWIEQEVQHDLAGAPWKKDDPTLVAEAGRCTDCPKRTGAHPALHPEVKAGKDLCLDPDCFTAKRQAFVQLQLKAVVVAHVAAVNPTGEAGTGKKVVGTVKAVKISPASSQNASKLEGAAKKDVLFAGYNGGYDRQFVVLKKPDECKSAQPAVVAEGPETGHARTVCIDHDCEKHWKNAAGGGYASRQREAPSGERKKQLAAEKVRRLEMAAREKALGQIVAKGVIASHEDLRDAATDYLGLITHERQIALCRSLGLEPGKSSYGGKDFVGPLKRRIQNLTGADVLTFLLAIAASDEAWFYPNSTRKPALLERLGARAKVSLAKIREELKAAKAAKKKPAKAVQASAGKKKPSAVSAQRSAKKKAGRK